MKLSSRVQVSQVGGARLKYSRRRKSFRDLICPLERTGNPPASEERKEGEFGRRGDKRRTRRVRNRCVRGTRGFLGMGPPLGSSSHKTPRDLSSFSSFVISHLQQNRADERERERERSTSAGFYPKYPRTRKEAWADSATDPPSSQWTLIISEVPRRFPRFSRGSSSNHRDLPIVEFDVSICWFEGTVFTTWNVSIHKLRHRVSESPGSPRVNSFLFF